MKLNQFENKDVEVVGLHNEGTMGIEISDKIFSMMIDGLYQDKIGAVIRELSSNAYDAHVEANNEKIPFEIHIPDEFNKNLVIKDYGNGLTKDELIKYFCTLLSSSKSDSNKYIGAYGIGAKSPFAIVDQFIVSSIKDGMKTTLLFLRKNKSAPNYYILEESKTDETSSTSIIIEYEKSNDIIESIKKQLVMFPLKPIVYQNGNIISNNLFFNVDKLSENIYLIDAQLSNTKTYIKCGPIVFPLPEHNLLKNTLENISLAKCKTIVYECNIGDLVIPPDRERLDLGTENIDFLSKLIKEKNDIFKDTILKDFETNYIHTNKYFTTVYKIKNWYKKIIII